MVSTNNKRASQPDTKAQRNTLKVLDTANIANFRQLAQFNSGARCPHAKRDVSPVSPKVAKEKV